LPDIPAGSPPPVPIEFGLLEWEEEVERYDPRSPARTQAQSARKAIEAGKAKLDWKRCKADGPRRTKLPGCRKLYVPLGREGASRAPYGFVFQLIQKRDDSLAWSLIAFGERHPVPRPKSAYQNELCRCLWQMRAQPMVRNASWMSSRRS
jgi:hypothetical protein